MLLAAPSWECTAVISIFTFPSAAAWPRWPVFPVFPVHMCMSVTVTPPDVTFRASSYSAGTQTQTECSHQVTVTADVSSSSMFFFYQTNVVDMSLPWLFMETWRRREDLSSVRRSVSPLHVHTSLKAIMNESNYQFKNFTSSFSSSK